MDGNVFVPPIFNVAPLFTVIVPPATVIPLLAVKDERSSVPLATVMFPAVEALEFKRGRLPANVLTSAPLMRSVP